MADDIKQVVTRMAPSPTGRFHVGGIRTAFYSYAFARKHGGKFILRIEDTDKERSEEQYEKEIYEAFAWVGLDYDEVFRQSEHLPRHQEVLKQMIETGHAYEAEDAKDGTGRVIRFKNPNTTIIFDDQILGEISVDTTDLGDFVIARNIESPLYHFAVIVDDHDEGVTHVIRGQEHVANTPRQILMIEALGWERPTYAHAAFILGPDGKKKLSKRDGDVAILDYREKGYLPEAMLNFLAFIGWNPGGDQEVYTKEEMIEAFSLEGIQKSPAGYNLDKLDWFNREHMKRLDLDTQKAELKSRLETIDGYSDAILDRLVPVIMERIAKWSDVGQMIADGEVQYYFTQPDYDVASLVWKKSDAASAQKHLKQVYELLQTYSGDWSDSSSLKDHLWEYAEAEGKGDVLWPLRYALSGRDRSPDPFQLLSILEADESLRRIAVAIEKLES